MTSVVLIEIENENKRNKRDREERKKEGSKEGRKGKEMGMGLVETYGQFVLGCM